MFDWFFLEIVVASHPIWTEISAYLDNKISKSGIHTIVFKNRYGIKDKLGIPIRSKTFKSYVIIDSTDETG